MIKNTYWIQLNIPVQLCFSRASASCSRILNIKSIFRTVKIFRATLFFRASASCSKILNDKKYFNRVKNSRATLFFRGRASCSKLLNVRSVFNTMNWATLFFRASAVAQKSWMVKNIFSTVKNFRETLFSGQAQAVKNPDCKKYIQYSGNFRAALFF